MNGTLGHAWAVHGPCIGHALAVHRLTLGHAKAMHWTHRRCAWGMHGAQFSKISADNVRVSAPFSMSVQEHNFPNREIEIFDKIPDFSKNCQVTGLTLFPMGALRCPPRSNDYYSKVHACICLNLLDFS